MSYLIVCVTALLASGLTLFSGFGLGTLLMPVFALFFPVEVAVAATALVHAANNIFKAVLLGWHANFRILFKFALPAAVAAMLGALLLGYLSLIEPIARYEIAGRTCMVTWVKLVISVLIAGFAVVELSPRFETLAFSERLVPLGGIISGFFGGLSGHQGALRSAFLIRTGMTKEAFIGTGVLTAIIVDVSRMIVYGATFLGTDLEKLKMQGDLGLIAVGTLSAFAGAFMGSRLLKKITMRAVQNIVGLLLLLLAAGMGSGLI
jgi:hypothetical protein